MRRLGKTCLLTAVALIGCNSSTKPLHAPDAGGLLGGATSFDAASPDLTAPWTGPDALSGGSAGIGAGGKTAPGGGTTGTGGAVGGTTSVVVVTAGTGGNGLAGSTSTMAGTISTGGHSVLAGTTATGGQFFVAGTTSIGGARLAGITAGTTVPGTGGAILTGGTTVSSASTSTTPSASGLGVYVAQATRGSAGALTLELRIDNKAEQAVDLANVTMRYWYQDEGLGSSPILDSLYVGVGYSAEGKVTGVKVVPLSPAFSGADRYLELSFTAILAPKGDSKSNDQFNARVTLHNAAYTGTVDVTNDYSYNAGATGYNDKITLHSAGKVIWGTPPSTVVPYPDGGVLPDSSVLPDVNVSPSVTFNAGQAQGAMSGYGWVSMGEKDIVTSPTCGPTNDPATLGGACLSSLHWDRADALCVTATLPAMSSASDYVDKWGIMIGVNASDPMAPIGRTFSTIALTFTGLPQTGVQVVLHRAGDPEATTYCAFVTSGTAAALGAFTTSCWNNTGASLTAADAPKIDKIGLAVMATTAEIIVDKLCLTSIVFGN